MSTKLNNNLDNNLNSNLNKIVEFKLRDSEYIELKNLLKVVGLCDTGGAAKHAIEQGEVLVDGIVETRKGRKLKIGQLVIYNKKQIKII